MEDLWGIYSKHNSSLTAVPGGLAQAHFCSWACCALFFIEKKVYCRKYSIFTCNLVFSKCLGRREWMDGTE